MIKESAVFLSQNISQSDKDEQKDSPTCVWDMGSKCESNIRNRGMFEGQLKMPVCDRHYIEHVMLMCARNLCDLEVENLVDAPDWSRVEMFNQEFGSESLNPEVCRDILTRIRAGDKDSVSKMSDEEVARAIVEELPV